MTHRSRCSQAAIVLFAVVLAGGAAPALGGQAEDLYALSLSKDPNRLATFIEALKSKDLAVRKAAASGLVFASSPEVLPAIEAAMTGEKSTFVRRCLIEAASRTKGPKAVAILEGALKDADEINRLAAAERLLRLGASPASTACVVKALGSDSREAVLMACEIAGTFCLPEAAAPLERIALGEENGGENSRDLFALRALDLIARQHADARPSALAAARGKVKTVGPFQRVEVARILGEFGDKQDLPVLHGWLSGQGGSWVEMQYPCALGLGRIKDPSSAMALTGALNETGKNRLKHPDFFKISVEYIRALVAIGDPGAIEGIKQYAASLPERTKKSPATQATSGPVEIGNRVIVPTQILRAQAAWARWSLGDPSAQEELARFVRHDDASVRREAAKCLERLPADRLTAGLKTALSEALAKESEPYTRTVLRRIAAAKGLPLPAEPAATTSQPALDPADNAPRYLLVNYDDCATISAMERLVEMTDRYADHGSRFVGRLMVAPGSRFDQDYLAVMLKRLYDRGYEIGNHTFYHNNDGWDYYRLPEHEMETEFKQCNTWLRDSIPGLCTIHAFWPGGSGFRPAEKPKIDRRDLAVLAAQWGLATNPPYRGGRGYFAADFSGPPYHEPEQYVSWYVAGDLSASHMFDSADEGVEAFKASFERFYAKPEGKTFFSFRHDWPLGAQEIRPGTKMTYPVFRGFLDWVMVDQKARFKNLKCITPLELSYILAGREKELDPAKGHIQGR